MQAVILAGGLGTRLRPFTEVIPKPLLPIGEKSLLEIQIERLKIYGCDEVFLATNYKSDYITNFFGDGSRYGIKLHVSKERKPLGTAGPVTLLKEHMTKPFIVMNGDILSLIDFRKFYEFGLSVDADLCVCIKGIAAPFAFGKISHEGDYVTDIEEKPEFKMEILAGIYLFKPALFSIIPEDEYFGMDTLIKKMLAMGKPVAKYDLNEVWLDIGQMPDYETAQDVYREHFHEEAEE